MNFKSIFLIVFLTCFVGCKEDVLPKPKAMLRLEYPEMASKKLEMDCVYEFEHSKQAQLERKEDCALTLDYPEMKGSIFISYKNVEGNLSKLMSDAQKFSYKGNAASQSQFYLTDSISHFVTGSLYFNTKPNYDSILPAAVYLQKDIRHIMETMRWKN